MPNLIIQGNAYNDWRDGTHTINVSRQDLIRAMITVGYRNRVDLHSEDLRIIGVRTLMSRLTISLLEVQDNTWVLSDSYRKLIQSEKASISYWFGMAFTKIASE